MDATWRIIPLPSLKLTFSPLKMDGWNTSFLLGWPIFSGYVSFREGSKWFIGLVSPLKVGLVYL